MSLRVEIPATPNNDGNLQRATDGVGDSILATLDGSGRVTDQLDIETPPIVDHTTAAAAGNATINQPAGQCRIDAAATAVVVTNNKVGANAVILLQKLDNDATLTDFKVVAHVMGSSFTITGNAAATAAVRFNFVVLNINAIAP